MHYTNVYEFLTMKNNMKGTNSRIAMPRHGKTTVSNS
jgi:hypothetical protein